MRHGSKPDHNQKSEEYHSIHYHDDGHHHFVGYTDLGHLGNLWLA